MKWIYSLIGFLFFISALKGAPVDSVTAKKVGAAFYAQNYQSSKLSLSLVYTERASSGEAEYYVYNVTPDSARPDDLFERGFVIVSAEDAGYPILGYSSEGYYKTTNMSPDFAFWMQRYKKQIAAIRSNHIKATADIQNEWIAYKNNIPLKNKRATSNVNALVKTTWAQEPYYNAYCPVSVVNGRDTNALAGCVATAMGQIMKYWAYPAHGLGASSYTDNPYGVLAANYDTTQYNWAAMPLKVTGNNAQVAALMFDCGVSVEMSYSISSSGAYMISSDDQQNSGISAQTAFVKYFGYNSSTIQGIYMSDYSYGEWVGRLETELNNNRPFFYAGSGSSGSHAWVCDGYNGIGDFHMNWGWAGYYDGYFNINSLNPDNIPLSSNEEALIGIEPPVAVAYFTANITIIRSGDTVTFTDNSLDYDTITSRQWSFPGGIQTNSGVLKPFVKYDNPGTYQVSETVTTDVGDNTLALSDYITVLENDPVNVYPTIGTGNLTIQLHDASPAKSNVQFSLYDVMGEKIYTTTLAQYITQVTLNVPHGMYFFRAFGASGKPVSTGKLIIE